MAIPPLPKSAVPLDLVQTDMPERFEASYDRDFDPVRLVGLFNFADETRDLVLDLPEGEWHVFELWDERYRGVCSGAVTFDLVSPHASRVVALRAADGEPRLVGTTAHIGLGVLDVTAQAIDSAPDETAACTRRGGSATTQASSLQAATADRATWLGQPVDVRTAAVQSSSRSTSIRTAISS